MHTCGEGGGKKRHSGGLRDERRQGGLASAGRSVMRTLRVMSRVKSRSTFSAEVTTRVLCQRSSATAATSAFATDYTRLLSTLPHGPWLWQLLVDSD